MSKIVITGKYGMSEGSTYLRGRVIIGPNDVNSESKDNTNAGSTAASGRDNPVPDESVR